MDQCSTLPEQGRLSHKLPDDDNASDCSTVPDDQDGQQYDSLSESSSSANSEVESLLLFDWDDTLFPTSWLMKHNLLAEPLSQEQEAQFQRLADRAKTTLEMAVQTGGKVVIITNAQQGWIEKTCTKFMPSLANLLKSLEIVSARSIYEKGTKCPFEWKRRAFEHEVELLFGSGDASQRLNLLSVGDSMHELDALKSVAKATPNAIGKSVKLLECPCIEQLIEQHEVLSSSLLDLVELDGSLDVEIGTES